MDSQLIIDTISSITSLVFFSSIITMVIVIVGDMHQIQAANSFLGGGIETETSPSDPILIIGCGRVGMHAAKQLERSGRNFRIVDKISKKGFMPEHFIVGDAADIDILEKAGIRTAPSVIITTHDDDTNIYLTLYISLSNKIFIHTGR